MLLNKENKVINKKNILYFEYNRMELDSYYICNSYKKYNFSNLKQSNRSTREIQNVILYTPNFCRENQSISSNELKSYIVSGITFFTRNSLNQITGLVNFDINQTKLNLLGICVPGQSKGIGSYLINLVKKFAKVNNISKIKLTCYDNLKFFYLKQNFKIINESSFYDSDYDSDSEMESNKQRYEMEFDMNDFKGGKKLKNRIKTVKKLLKKKIKTKLFGKRVLKNKTMKNINNLKRFLFN